jgi:hypothetical protein
MHPNIYEYGDMTGTNIYSKHKWNPLKIFLEETEQITLKQENFLKCETWKRDIFYESKFSFQLMFTFLQCYSI